MAICQHNDGGVGQAERKIRVLLHNGKGSAHVIPIDCSEGGGRRQQLAHQRTMAKASTVTAGRPCVPKTTMRIVCAADPAQDFVNSAI